jgi:hypothetical protein
MTRTFTIHDTPNDKGFDRYTVRSDHGKTYLDNVPMITTNDELRLINRLIQWIREGKP